MNKKIIKFIFAAVVAIAAVMPLIATTDRHLGGLPNATELANDEFVKKCYERDGLCDKFGCDKLAYNLLSDMMKSGTLEGRIWNREQGK